MKILKPRSKVTDKITNKEGMITNVIIETDESIRYLFKAKGLNIQDGGPLLGRWTTIRTLDYKIEDVVDISHYNIDLSILNTEVEDIASGYKGTAMSLVLHPNGCLHVDVQSDKINPETGELNKAYNFDIRMLKGPQIKEMDELERRKDEIKKPSPCDYPPFERIIS